MDILIAYMTSGIFLSAKIYKLLKLSLNFVKSNLKKEAKQFKI